MDDMLSNKGQAVIAAAIILAIIAVGIFIVMSAMGHNPLETAKNCTEVIYNSGIVDKVCQ
jgi:hypothetical protein